MAKYKVVTKYKVVSGDDNVSGEFDGESVEQLFLIVESHGFDVGRCAFFELTSNGWEQLYGANYQEALNVAKRIK